MNEDESRKAQFKMFGCSQDILRDSFESSANQRMMILGTLSDSQDLMDMDQQERARQAINRAKWMIVELFDGIRSK